MTKMKTQSYQTLILIKFADNDRCLKNHMVLQSDISKDHGFHDQGQYERLYTSQYFDNALQGYIHKICEMYVMSIW